MKMIASILTRRMLWPTREPCPGTGPGELIDSKGMNYDSQEMQLHQDELPGGHQAKAVDVQPIQATMQEFDQSDRAEVPQMRSHSRGDRPEAVLQEMADLGLRRLHLDHEELQRHELHVRRSADLQEDHGRQEPDSQDLWSQDDPYLWQPLHDFAPEEPDRPSQSNIRYPPELLGLVTPHGQTRPCRV